eukprot:1192466-Prorocentrum_minimum.AAC.5
MSHLQSPDRRVTYSHLLDESPTKRTVELVHAGAQAGHGGGPSQGGGGGGGAGSAAGRPPRGLDGRGGGEAGPRGPRAEGGGGQGGAVGARNRPAGGLRGSGGGGRKAATRGRKGGTRGASLSPRQFAKNAETEVFRSGRKAASSGYARRRYAGLVVRVSAANFVPFVKSERKVELGKKKQIKRKKGEVGRYGEPRLFTV